MQNGPELRGFERVMASEIHVSDLLQEITDRDPTPWNELINLVPIDCFREHPFTRLKKANSVPGSIDLLLVSSDDTEVLIEVKLSHHFSDDQRERYESSGGDVLCLLGMEADRDWVARFPRWTFMSLESVFKAWIDSHDEKAATLAQMAATTLEEWNYGVNSVFRDNKRGETLDQINRRFLATLVARRLFLEIMELGWFARHSKSVGSGMPIVQGFAPLNDDLNRCLIAEARWLTSYETINIRFGVDFSICQIPKSPDLKPGTWRNRWTQPFVLTRWLRTCEPTVQTWPTFLTCVDEAVEEPQMMKFGCRLWNTDLTAPIGGREIRVLLGMEHFSLKHQGPSSQRRPMRLTYGTL